MYAPSHTYRHTLAHALAWLNTYTHIHAFWLACTHAYTLAYMHTRKCICIHTHMHTLPVSLSLSLSCSLSLFFFVSLCLYLFLFLFLHVCILEIQAEWSQLCCTVSGCDPACAACHGPGHDDCRWCSDGYLNKDNECFGMCDPAQCTWLRTLRSAELYGRI